MKNIRIVCHYDGQIGRGAKCTVTAKTLIRDNIHDIPSPSSMRGHGTDFGSALNDYIAQLDAYIEALKTARDDYIDTSKPYSNAIHCNSKLNTAIEPIKP